jgi:phage tail-like protein
MSNATQGRADDPYAAFLFSVTVSPGEIRHGEKETIAPVGGFSDVSGLNFETEVETLRVGGVNDTDVTLPGPSKASSRLVLKRGLADASFLWAWYLRVMRGEILRQQVTVSIHDPLGEPRQSWTFRDACPVKWTGPDLHASSSAVGFESIELIHRGLLPSAK